MAERAAPVTVVRPGEGAEGSLGSIGVVFKLFGKDTGGQLSIVEHPFPVGAIVPPHLHTREDEFSIVTEGEIGFRSGDDEVVLGPGGYVTKPRNELHTMWNAGQVPARMIEVIQPAGFEGFFWELAEHLAAGAPDPQTVGRLAERYGLVFRQAPWLADVVARYHLPERDPFGPA
ncbi:MAG TPA: cupin domain-containing protein [Acidimicrobiales bacterium]|nr:cupin domain-containing protein [Acidimicrobiales bacterium]